jgi:hypothetical protein
MRGFMVVLAMMGLSGCSDAEHPHDGEHEGEVITTVRLALTAADGTTAEFSWSDPEMDGSPVIDPIVLDEGGVYAVAVQFLDEASDPAEDITGEVAEESDEHQVFFTGSAVSGPAVSTDAEAPILHAYADTDANGLPIGLDNTFTAQTVGSGDLIVTLRHLPPENDSAVKLEGLAQSVASGGFSAIGGDNDAQVTFPVTVE